MDNNGTLTIRSNLTSSGSLIVNGNSTGLVTYNRILREGNVDGGDKHLFSSPVGGQDIGTFISASNTGIVRIDSIRTWNEVNANWPRLTSGTFDSGKGYNVYQTDVSDGDFSFTGTVVSSASIPATSPYLESYAARLEDHPLDPYGVTDHTYLNFWTPGRNWENFGGGAWNLLGNPFTSALKITEDPDNGNNFLSINEASFDPNYVAVYIYNGVTDRYLYQGKSTGFEDPTGESPENLPFNNYNMQAGQGFFVLANNQGATFSFPSSLRIHSVALPMMKSAGAGTSWPGLQLKVKYGSKESLTTVFYHETMTAGLDPGYDIGQFSTGPEVELYTTLASKDNSVNFARQALPVMDAEKIIIPVGIDTEKGGEVTFSAYTVPLGNNKFWLEDRMTGIFTDLTTKSYTVTLPAKTYGTGRFFIIASTNTPTGIKDRPMEDGSDLRIWTSNDKVIIKGEVSERAICEVYDIQGKRILERRLADKELNIVDVPSGMYGVYLYG